MTAAAIRTVPVRFKTGPQGLIDPSDQTEWHPRVARPGDAGELIVQGDPPIRVPDGWLVVRVEHNGGYLYCPVTDQMIEATTVEVRVPGYVYYECFDPCATDVPRDCGWPHATSRRVGKGLQFRYSVTEDTAREMLDNAETFGEALSHGVDDTRPGRETLRWVERERARLGLSG